MTELLSPFELWIQRFRAETPRISQITEAIDLLIESGLIEALRLKSVITIQPNARPDAATLGIVAAQSAGYNECLDDILRFKEKYLIDYRKTLPEMDYGASRLAVEKGYMTEGELNK